MASDLNTPLRQKLVKAQATPAKETGDMSPRRALRLALAQSALSSLNMTVTVLSIDREKSDRNAVLDHLTDASLLVALEQDDGSRGAIGCDPQLVAAMLECQTLGLVLEAAAGRRQASRTDAAISMPMIDQVLSRFETLMAVQDATWSRGFRFGKWVNDKKALNIALMAENYDLFRVELGLADTNRRGIFVFAAPVRVDQATPAPQAQADPPPASISRQHVLQAPLSLSAILNRQTIDLAKAMSLRPGDRLPIDARLLSEVVLQVREGKTAVATAQLGQLKGQRALKIMSLTTAQDQAQQGFAPLAEETPGVPADRVEATEQPARQLPVAPPQKTPVSERALDAEMAEHAERVAAQQQQQHSA